MNYLQIMTHPATIYAVIVALAAAAGALALLQRLNFKALERYLLERQSETEDAIGKLRCELGKVADDLDGLEQAASVPSPGAVVRGGMNLARRAHALRMHRRGDGPEQIAAALGIPRQEVELLLKVHRIVVAQL